VTLTIIVSPDLTGYGPGWDAVTEDYDGAPDSRGIHSHVGHGITQHDAITDLLAWLDADDDELADVRVIVEMAQ
jgi:hypothetical protein